jgi:hypothetical protein
VAGILGAVGAAFWGPSILAGGVKSWQLALPPAALLATAFLLVRKWVSERVATRPAIALIAGGTVATVLVLAAGIGYRVLEIPIRAGSEDDVAYVAELVPIERNLGGRDFKAAAERFNRTTAVVNPLFDRTDTPIRPARADRVEERADRVLRLGWTGDDPELGDWLDEIFKPATDGEEAWYDTAARAAEAPIGIFEYPQLLGLAGPSTQSIEHSRRMAVALLARGLQQQAGRPDQFPQQLRTVLALARTLRNGSIVKSLLAGIEVERAGLLGLDRWLDQLPHDARRIRAAIELIQTAEPAAPFDPAPHFLAERHVLREGMKSPSQWLPHLLAAPGAPPEATSTEVDLVGLAWAVPWERERTRRVVAMGFEAGLPSSLSTVVGRPGLGLIIARMHSPRDLIDLERLLMTHRRAAILKLLLRAYRTEKGKYPDALAELESAGLLPQAPRDPYRPERTFGYRIAKPPGELLVSPSRLSSDRPGGAAAVAQGSVETQHVPPGQPIIWSIGPDGIDQHGRNLPSGLLLGQARPADLVYLVPMGPEKPD